MNAAPQNRTPSKAGPIASAAAATVMAAFAAMMFLYVNIIWNPAYYGEYGLTVDHWSNFSVKSIVPGSPAYRAGITVGDRVEWPRALRERLQLFRIAPHPGERITLSILRGDQRHIVTLQARPLPPLPLADRILLAVKFAWLFVFIAVSYALVLLRPSIMTWGLFFFPFNLMIIFLPSDLFFSYIPTNWFIALRIARDLIAPAGIVGFLIFATRFPANAATGWRAVVQNLAPFLYVVIAAPLVYWDLVNVVIPSVTAIRYAFEVSAVVIFAAGTIALLRYRRRDEPERRRIAWLILGMLLGVAAAAVGLLKQSLKPGPEQHWTAHATLTLGTIGLLVTYFGGRGLERQRIKWVVFGVICAWIADGADHLGLSLASFYNPKWFIGILEVLYVALPFAVAYAVIRHRVIDIRFVVSRALVVSVIASIASLIFFGIDWLFSTRLPSSRLEAAVYAGAALIVGFGLNAVRQRIAKAIDFIFFRQWHQAREQADAIGDAMRRATSKVDLYEPLTAGIASAFSLASVALFERIEGGGFVRDAAYGWQQGTIWHMLPDDPPVASADRSHRTVDLETIQWHEDNIPAGIARPTVLMPILAGRRVPALLLCGAHENGTGLAPDEIRAICRLCADAGPLYARSLAQEFA